MNSRTFLLCTKIFAFWIFLLGFFYLAGNILFGGMYGISLINLANWDGRHYLDIAQFGYQQNLQYAFFPLFPILINTAASFTGLSFFNAALLINLLSVFGSIYLFTLLLKKYGVNPIKGLLLLLIFPTSFYLLAIYSEGLFLFLALASFLFAERKRFFISVLFASLATLTRITGIAVILSLALYVFSSKLSLTKKIIITIISCTGLIFYGVYLYLQTGNPFYFLISELSWGRNIEVPGFNIADSLIYITSNGVRPESFTILSDLLFTIFGLGMGIRVVRFLKPPLAVYTIAALFIPLTTALLLSVPRFLLVVFPIFIVLSKINNRIFNLSYVIISLTLCFLYFNFFLRNIWVS